MCVIVRQPRGAYLDKERAKRLWKQNSDGGGFAWIGDNGEIETRKFMEFHEFWPNFESTRSTYTDREYLLHMRIATHGSVRIENVHPFRIDEHTVMAHNGVLPWKIRPGAGDDRSDTLVLAEDWLPSLPGDWLDNPILVAMVEDLIGSSNKLMFLTNSPELSHNVYILNSEAGTEIDGMWFSNSIGVNPPPPKKPSTKGVQGSPKYGYHRGSEDSPSSTIADKKAATSGTPSTAVWVNGEMTVMSNTEYADYLEQKYGVRNLNSYAQGATCEADLDPAEGEPEVVDDEDKLNELREEYGLVKPFFLNPLTMLWECLGCDAIINVHTGECDCWTRLCTACESWANDCVCKDGYSYNLTNGWDATPELIKTANLKGDHH
jgi:glutamine amidotransferase